MGEQFGKLITRFSKELYGVLHHGPLYFSLVQPSGTCIP